MSIFEKNTRPANANGLNLARTARYVFDPSSDATLRTVAAHAFKGEALPDNAVITRAFYDVITTFTSAADTATIALSVEGAGDILAAVAINDGGNPWDAGVQITDIVETAATMVKLTAARIPVATVAVQALTAGKCILHVEYFVSE